MNSFLTIESLHNAVRTNTRTILPCPLFPFCIVRYWEKQQNTVLFLNSFMTEIKIATKCEYYYSCHSIWFCTCGMNSIKSFETFSCVFLYRTCEEETNMAVESAMIAKSAWYDVTWKPSMRVSFFNLWSSLFKGFFFFFFFFFQFGEIENLHQHDYPCPFECTSAAIIPI